MLSILSRWLIQFCLYLDLTSCIPGISSSFLKTSLLVLSSRVYPLTLFRKRISAASRRVVSRFVVTHVSLPPLLPTTTRWRHSGENFPLSEVYLVQAYMSFHSRTCLRLEAIFCRQSDVFVFALFEVTGSSSVGNPYCFE